MSYEAIQPQLNTSVKALSNDIAEELDSFPQDEPRDAIEGLILARLVKDYVLRNPKAAKPFMFMLGVLTHEG